MSDTPHFDRLAAVLFDGAVKVDHIHMEFGTNPNVTPSWMGSFANRRCWSESRRSRRWDA